MPAVDQPGLFDNDAPEDPLPARFKYQADTITPDDERQLLRQLETLPFEEFQFHRQTPRRVVGVAVRLR